MDNFLNASLKVTHIPTAITKMYIFEINRENNQTEFKLHSHQFSAVREIVQYPISNHPLV